MTPSTAWPAPEVGERHRPTGQRSPLKAVGLPTEHGGWGITTEVVVLGLLVAPSAAGVCLAVAALLAFLARTPLKVVLVDRRRRRSLARTRLAQRLFGVEAVLLVALAALALRWGSPGFWWPLIGVVPVMGIELAYDMRSRSRRLVPELAGSVGIAGVASMIALAGGRPGLLAAGIWLVLAARSITSIVTVRNQVAALHGRSTRAADVWVADAIAIGVALVAVLVEPALAAGAFAVGVLVGAQRMLRLLPTDRAVVIGLRQTALGAALVVACALGIILS